MDYRSSVGILFGHRVRPGQQSGIRENEEEKKRTSIHKSEFFGVNPIGMIIWKGGYIEIKELTWIIAECSDIYIQLDAYLDIKDKDEKRERAGTYPSKRIKKLPE